MIGMYRRYISIYMLLVYPSANQRQVFGQQNSVFNWVFKFNLQNCKEMTKVYSTATVIIPMCPQYVLNLARISHKPQCLKFFVLNMKIVDHFKAISGAKKARASIYLLIRIESRRRSQFFCFSCICRLHLTGHNISFGEIQQIFYMVKHNISFGEIQRIFYMVKHFLQQKRFASLQVRFSGHC